MEDEGAVDGGPSKQPSTPAREEHAQLLTTFNQLSISGDPGTPPPQSKPPQTPRTARKSPQKKTPLERRQPRSSSKNTATRSTPAVTAHPSPAPRKDTNPESQPPEVSPGTAFAAACFVRELERHADLTCAAGDTVVIIHDACYGHRYSRPKTPKATLGLIVERPERLQAGVLGIANAYVRLGGRHSAGSQPLHPEQQSPTQLPFRIQRTDRVVPLTSPPVTSVHGTKWMQELKTLCDDAEGKLATSGKELARADDGIAGVGTTKAKFHEGDLYLCKESLQAFEGALGGVFDGIDLIFGQQPNLHQHRKAFVCVRPPGHHCSADFPSGFCWINNVHVGIEYAVQNHGLTHAAIIDFDLHHGDGSQTITWERNARIVKNPKVQKKALIGYFSLHDINSYPCEYGDKEKVQNASLCIENAHNQSIWNVHLQAWKTEEEFWQLYESRYSLLLEKARAFLRHEAERLATSSPTIVPKAAIFVSAGFDASEWEGEGMQRHKVNVPTEFYARFTADIARLAQEEGTGVQGRVISVLEGGYSDRALTSGVLGHLSGLVGSTQHTNNTGIITANSYQNTPNPPTVTAYQKDWSSLASLVQLETTMDNARRPLTYFKPTESFIAKIVDPTSVQKTTFASSNKEPGTEATIPDVDWSTATHELCKLLIPSDRSINSCKYEELADRRIKRERHSATGVPGAETSDRRQLRGRKSKASESIEVENGGSITVKPSVMHRRRTISHTPILPLGGSDQPIPSTEVPLDTKVTPSDAVPARGTIPRQSSSAAAPPLRLPKTRDTSGIKAELAAVPPVTRKPPVPKFPRRQSSDTSSRVDDLTTQVKKITLKLSTSPAPIVPPPPSSQAAIQTARKPPTSKPKRIVKEPAATISHARRTSRSSLLPVTGAVSASQEQVLTNPAPTDISAGHNVSVKLIPHSVSTPATSSTVPPPSNSSTATTSSQPLSSAPSSMSVAPIEVVVPTIPTTSAPFKSSASLDAHSRPPSYGMLAMQDIAHAASNPSPFASVDPQSYGPIASLASSSINGSAPEQDRQSHLATPLPETSKKGSPRKPKVRLPTFPANGHIPFAQQQSQTQTQTQPSVTTATNDVWEVPDTPHR